MYDISFYFYMHFHLWVSYHSKNSVQVQASSKLKLILINMMNKTTNINIIVQKELQFVVYYLVAHYPIFCYLTRPHFG